MRAYNWFWWHTEFWLVDHKAKRPYTYIFRDYPAWFFVFVIALALGAWLSGTWFVRGPVFAFVFFLAGHVWWGSKIITGQQEEPPYNPGA